MQKVMVYGTLKKGQRNEPFLDGQRYMGRCYTEGENFKLLNITDSNYPFPGLIEASDGHRVFGELYGVSDEGDRSCLTALDRLEGVAYGLYKRSTIVVIDEKGERHEVLAYQFAQDKGRYIDEGPVWPRADLSMFQMTGRTVVRNVVTKEVTGVALFDKRGKIASPPQADTAKLNEYIKQSPGRWNSPTGFDANLFEVKETQYEADVTEYRLLTEGGEASPPLSSLVAVCEWAVDNATLFGGDKASRSAWEALIEEYKPIVANDD